MNKLIIIPILALILLAIDYYVFQAVRTITADWGMQARKVAHSIYWGFSVLLMVGLFTYHFVDPEVIGKNVRTVIMVLIFIVYISKLVAVVFVLIDDIIRLVRWVYNQFSSPSITGQSEETVTKISRSEFLAKMGLVVASVPALAMTYGIVAGAHDYRIRRKKVHLPNLPDAFDGLKIVQISDIHAGSFFNKTAVARGIKMIQEQGADLIFFTGDLVNNRATEIENYIDLFGSLSAPMGIFSVLGNHDYGDYVKWESKEAKAKNLEGLKKAHGRMGWRLLLNEHQILEKDNQQIAILGIENWGTKGFVQHGKMKDAYKGTENVPVKILLSHDPSHWDAEVRQKYQDIDLTLSGHTHGMQFGVEIGSIKWSPIKYRYKQWGGLYQEAKQYIYVNRGFGYLGYPGRIGMPPEITVLELKKELV